MMTSRTRLRIRFDGAELSLYMSRRCPINDPDNVEADASIRGANVGSRGLNPF